ncbi:hypothetical protein HMPREF8571_0716 [Streptococcus mitis ATCC 6249]|uniref:Uncharacterized protein n=1 Tax=Streptococcus mitis ATCC 6249 TaxID=864567 RepID=E0PQ99_STRMT|nr:hypothetical protein HMPREF8571_0716 [Streptococcus mitis ATCC 6249]
MIDLTILSCFQRSVKKSIFKFSHLSQKVKNFSQKRLTLT